MSTRVPIRAVAGRFSLDISRKALESAMRVHPFAFCAHVSGAFTGQERFRPFSSLPAEAQEWFASSEVRYAQYVGIDWNTVAPLDEELIQRMRECESLFMSVVTRLESKRSIPYLTRKLWYLRHLQFWNAYLTRNRINLYISAWIPHEIPDIILYHLCKARGIPVLYFDITVLRDVSFAGSDVRHAAPQIGNRYEELLVQYAGSAPDSILLGEPFASYERALLPEAGEHPALVGVSLPTYWSQLQRLAWQRPVALLRYALKSLTPAGLVRAFWAMIRWTALWRADRFYDRHAELPDLARPFVYLPLHFQPEISTLPMGGAFADQILVARILQASLPDDILLYVKEHPQRSSWTNRSIAYYEDFLQLAKVRLVPRTFDTFALREHCAAVATITGSAGFEALFRGKPVFLFGSCYYQYARGVFPIRSVCDCEAAVRHVFEQKEAPTRWSTRLYLKAMEETCVAGVMDPWYLTFTQRSEEEHVRAMTDAIVSELDRMQSEIARASH
jgi:hypothetical protein